MRPHKQWLIAALMIVGLLFSACGPAPTPPAKSQAAHVESIEGSDLKRVMLTEDAAKRLDIQTVSVRDELVTRTRTVGGEVVASSQAGSADANVVWVRVSLNESDLNKVDKGHPALIQSLDVEDGEDADDLEAEADDGPDDDAEDGALYYLVDGAQQSLKPGQRVLVELSLLDGTAQRLIIPYSAVIYGLNGEAWVYTNPEPLTFVRQPITIEYVDDDEAVLSEGPAAGTEVVTVGGAELFGVESGIGGGH